MWSLFQSLGAGLDSKATRTGGSGMALVLFWGALALIMYTYVFFPMLIVLRGLLWRRPHKSAEITPGVSLMIAAYNEADSIAAKLDNSLSLDYPRDRLQVVVVSDGSNDGTDGIVSEYARQGVKLLSLPRQGKVPALNTAVEACADNEILVFSDANTIYAPDAIRALVRPFADAEVGGVAGNQCYISDHSTATGDGERSYWNFDRILKQYESRAGNTISATGAIYAIRRSLFQPVALGLVDDFVISTQVIAQGYRLVFAPDAVAYEPVAGSSRAEFDRKARTILLGLRSVLAMRELLNPFEYGFYALQLFSHKVLRRLMFFPLLVLLLASPLLWNKGVFYQVATLAQGAFYASGILGALIGGMRLGKLKVFTLPFFFCMANAASLVATLRLLGGHRIDRWEPTKAGFVTPANVTSSISLKRES
jgi:cellulose synthase/poly-beta-1,6-N-acetylglucosamine synthase-like glycosyltransferase